MTTQTKETTATAKYVRVSASKVRQLLPLIVGMPVLEAVNILRFAEKGAATPLLKVVQSAAANAENNDGYDPDELVITRAWADVGPTMRRFQPRAQGRAFRIRKRTCHITVAVASTEEV
jgi:large subunit ribosomal protein L22